ncbi:MAG TPA: hypothetical protein VMW38_01280 [Terriglobia bacterium]|nr:hypothetical protein [Terriglobia bacterium]
MLRFWKKRDRLGKPDLPDDAELLAYLDGEVTTERHAEIEVLNEESWEIRLRLAELVRDVETYTEASSQLVPQEIPPFERVWKGPPLEVGYAQAEKLGRIPPSKRSPSKSAGVTPFSQWLGSLTHSLSPTVSLAAALAVLIVVVAVFLIRISSAPPVSAKELLKRTITAEEQRIHIVTAPVIYQKLRVHRKSSLTAHEDAATWEIWNDASHNRFTQRVESASGAYFVPHQGESPVAPGNSSVRGEPKPASVGGQDKTSPPSNSKELNSELSGLPPVLSELNQVYQANRMDQRRPLSPEAFEAWQSHARRRIDQVEEVETSDGLKEYVLTSEPSGPFTENAIVRGQILVRVTDWHPVEQRLRVQGVQGIQDFQVTESRFQVVALNTLDPAIFASLMPAPSGAVDVSAPATPLIVSPDPADLLAAEIEAHYALHRVKACLGESIEVVPVAKGRIEVRGLAASAEQKEKLIGELRRVPFVTMRLQTIQEAMKAGIPAAIQGQTSATNAPSPEPTITVRSPRLPIQEQLEQYFAKSDSNPSSEKDAKIRYSISELSTEAVTLSRSTLSNAWALRRLAEAFGPTKVVHVRMQSRWLLEAMVRDHLREIQNDLGRSHGLLGPILSSVPSGMGSSPSSKSVESITSSSVAASDWVSQTLVVFHNVEQMDLLTNGLFAGAGLPTEDSGQAAQGLLSIYADLPSKCAGLEREIAKEFSSVENQLATHGRPQ